MAPYKYPNVDNLAKLNKHEIIRSMPSILNKIQNDL